MSRMYSQIDEMKPGGNYPLASIQEIERKFGT
jgi:hypothetical protein